MPISPSFPGVYIEEVPSGVRAITGVGTAVTAFVGYTRSGPINEPVTVYGFADYERAFGPLDPDSHISYAVYHYFLNGGSEAVVVRVAPGAMRASVTLLNGTTSGTPVLTATARELGTQGNTLRVEVLYESESNPHSAFSLRVVQYGSDETGAPKVVGSEAFSELTMNRQSPRYAVRYVNERSRLITLARSAEADTAALTLPDGTSTGANFGGGAIPTIDSTNSQLRVSINGMASFDIDLMRSGDATLTTDPTTFYDALASRIASRIQNHYLGDGVYGGVHATAEPIAGPANCVVVRSTVGGEARSVHISRTDTNSAAQALRFGAKDGGYELDATATLRPVHSGTVGVHNAAQTVAADTATRRIRVSVTRNGTTGPAFTLVLYTPPSGTPLTTVPTADIVDQLQAQMRAQSDEPVLRNASAKLIAGRLVVSSSVAEPNTSIGFSAYTGDNPMLVELGLSGATFTPDPISNVLNYAPAQGSPLLARGAGVAGNDGGQPTMSDLRGLPSDRTGLYALDKTDYFSILCMPSGLGDPQATTVYQEAQGYCEKRRAMLLIDAPSGLSESASQNFLTGLRHKNAAGYYPRLKAFDPAQNGLLRSFPTSGAVAGIYARTDAERGIWKAPAGMDATIRGVQALDDTLTEGTIGRLNGDGVNCLRTTPLNGAVVWGARTLAGYDEAGSEWKYVPVRRLALYLEESLYRGTQWVVFEPNDEPLWSQVRLNVGSFMHSLFRQGAFQGKSPAEAYLVKCDRETTTQDDINRGIVNIIVGFAPLKPAEFVILKIQQLAGQAGA